MAGDFWSKAYPLVHVGGVDVVLLKLFIDKKDNVPTVTDAFSMIARLQICGFDIVNSGALTIDPIKTGSVTMKLIGNLGRVDGNIITWVALDANQDIVPNPTFENARFISFTLVGQGHIDIPINAAPLPIWVKLILDGIKALLGTTITISLGTIHEVIPLPK